MMITKDMLKQLLLIIDFQAREDQTRSTELILVMKMKVIARMSLVQQATQRVA